MMHPMKMRRATRRVLLVTLLAASGSVFAAWEPDIAPATSWSEGAVPPPPAYSTNDLIAVTVPQFATVKIGVDPKSISVDLKTGVVRYVTVARGPSALTASYTGLRCKTAEYRVYAYQSQGEPWATNTDDTWHSMKSGGSLAQIAFQLARNGMCLGPSVRTPVDAIVRELRSGDSSLYR